MRTLPPGLAEHVSGDATTLCHAWRLTRGDGVVLGFTDHDADLTFDGTVFLATSGFDASDAETALGLAAATGDVSGAFSADCITEKDLKDGRFDGATVETFLVNWQAPEQFIHLRTQEIGEVTSDGQSFRTELRSLANRLERVQGRVYTRTCDAQLGDGRCRVDLSAAAYRGEGAVIASNGTLACTASGLSAFASGWFRFGLVTWTRGANAGLQSDVEDHRISGDLADLSFWIPVPNALQPGDTFAITAGCAKTFDVCRAKFSNGLNFQGFPHMPGSDFAYGYADTRSVHDGRPLFP